jgi:hypothetical protein
MRLRTAAAVAVCLITISPRSARAQAWPSGAGTGAVTLVFQSIRNAGHIVADGTRKPKGSSRSAAVALEAEYGVTDRLAVSASVPYVFAKYIGPGSLGPLLRVDACHCWHSAFADATITARYSILGGAFALTPSVALLVPTHDYPYRGEAVVGRRLPEWRFAVAAGQRLDAISPRLSVQVSYSYTAVRRVLDVPNNRSNAAVQGGVSLTRRISINGSLSWQRTHGGLRTGLVGPPPAAGFPFGDIADEALFMEHDRMLRDDSFHAGAGIAWSLPGLGIDLLGSYVEFVSGRDTHYGRAFTVGISRPF